jgi:drug/metabolite transporter (DMT)-like permease
VTWQPYVVLAVGLIAVSSASVFIRFAQNEGAPSLIISAWRLVLATLVLTPLILLRHRHKVTQWRGEQITLGVVAGVMLALHFASWITSLEYTSVLISVVLVTTNPLFVALLTPVLLRERLSRGTVIAVLVAITGGVIITLGGDAGTAPKQDAPLLGAVLALVGAVTFALYFLIGRRLRASITVIPYIWLTYGVGAVTLLAILALGGQIGQLGTQTGNAYLWMTLVGLVPQLIGHSSYNYALGYMSAAFVALSVLFEPIGSSILAVMFLNEQPSWVQLVGGALILVALYLGSRAERRPPTA